MKTSQKSKTEGKMNGAGDGGDRRVHLLEFLDGWGRYIHSPLGAGRVSRTMVFEENVLNKTEKEKDGKRTHIVFLLFRD